MRNKTLVKHSTKIFAFMMSVVLSAGLTVPVSAAEKKEQSKEEKTETVYVNAGADGAVKKITVSNWLKNSQELDALEDYSSLENIQNVKGDETFTQNEDGSILWDSKGNDIYYQGETNKELPVSMSVSYYLDGKKIEPSELAGKSGKIKIRFDYYNHSEETVKVKGKNYHIQTPFTMITAMILPSDIFTDVEVTNGKVLTDGDKNIVVGLAFPGLKNSLNLTSYEKLDDISIPEYVEVSADAEDFALALSVTAASTGTLGQLNTGNFKDIDSLKENISELTDASTQLVNGSKELADGLDTLSSSFGTFTKGVSDADEGAKELKKGLKTLDEKKIQLSDGAKSLNDGLKTLKSGTESLNQGIKQYTGGVSDLDTGLKSAGSGALALNRGAEDLSDGMTSYTDGVNTLKQGINQLNDKVSSMGNVALPDEDTLKAVKTAADALESDAQKLQENADDITKAIETMNHLAEDVKSHNKKVKDKFDQAEDELDKVDDKAASQANDKIKNQESDINSEAKSQAIDGAKAAVDKTEGLSDEQKSALKSALENSIRVDVHVKDIEINGVADSVKDALGEAPQLDVSSINLSLSSMESLLNDMKKQAAILENFAKSTGQMSGLAENIPELISGVSDLNDGVNTLSGSNKTLLSGMKQLLAGLDSLSDGLTVMQTGAKQLTGNNSELINGADSLDKGTSQLQSGSKDLKTGIETYTKGVGAAYKGSSALADGTAKLNGAGSLLTDGIDKLVNGAGTLNAGMKTFDEEGIGKLSDLAGEDLQSVMNHMKAVKKADESYTSFTGKSKEMKGSVKFIIETDAVEAEEDK